MRPKGCPTAKSISASRTRIDDMTDEELARLNEALARGFESIKAGRFRLAADVVTDLRR
jgi:hypothetical protein